MHRTPTGQACLSGADGSRKLYFQFNPETIKIEHTSPGSPTDGNEKQQGVNADGKATTIYTSAEDEIRRAGTTTVSIDNIVFDGAYVQEKCDQLLYWTYAATNAVGRKDTKKKQVPLVTFMWGSVVIHGTMNRVSVTYTRFSGKGVPTRATVGLSIYQRNVPSTKTVPTNPTSGGLPGRRTHVLVSGECLPAVATASYGGPGDWRPLAQANRIEDPLRVRPGTILYLPAPGEFGREGPARS